jgi:hypothetical protein
MNFHSGYITKNQKNGKTIFTFGSNLSGIHGKGSALTARKHWGAIYGRGSGHQGHSYAIPTKDQKLKTLPLKDIQYYVEQFIELATTNPDLKYLVVRIGCMLAGYKDEQIAPMFKDASDNVYLPPEWKPYLQPEKVGINLMSDLIG